MWEYLLVASCFAVLILIRLYLFKVTYENRLKYYSDPEELAKEFYANLQQQKTEPQIKQMIDNFHLMVLKNIQTIQQLYQEKVHDKQCIMMVQEKLRNSSLIIAIIQNKFKDDPNAVAQRLRIVTQTIYQQFGIFTSIRLWCKDQSNNKKMDQQLLLTIQKYTDYIVDKLQPYLRPA